MKNCRTCNQEFQETRDRTIFCSHKCQAKWAITRAEKYKKPRARTGSILICPVCSDKFYVEPNRLKNPRTKYCSRSCLAKIELSKYNKIYGFKKTGKPPHKYKIIKINGKHVREHRWIMEQHLGRKLERWEHVHHINDDSSDNRLENLEVLSNADHQRKEYLIRKKLTSVSSF